MNILVTGAGGFIGSSLVCSLEKDKKHTIISTSRIISQSIKSSSSLYYEGDLYSLSQQKELLDSVDVIVHCAGLAHAFAIPERELTDQCDKINFQATLKLAKSATKAAVKRFIFISSIKVNGEESISGVPFSEKDRPNPLDPYAKSKCKAEEGLRQLAVDTEMEIVIIRPPLVYGPGVKGNFRKLLQMINSGYPLPLGNIHNKRSYIALDNLLEFIKICMTDIGAANQTFLVSDGEDLSTTELVRRICSIKGKKKFIFPLPHPVLLLIANLTGKRDSVQKLCGNLQIDSGKAKSLLHWQPKLTVNDALRLTVDE